MIPKQDPAVAYNVHLDLLYEPPINENEKQKMADIKYNNIYFFNGFSNFYGINS